MACSACGEPTVVAAVPETIRQHAPDDADRIAICSTCLSIVSTDTPGTEAPDFTSISGAFPADAESAVGVAVLVHLLDSLVHNRESIQSLVDWLETGGTDVFLVIDRLATDPSLEPAVDLERRRTQLEQFVE
jgi:pyruvate/2-oxoacid:ferredoxin oxidoreductase beta subunit